MKSQTINLLKKEIKLGNTVQTLIWTICCFCMFFIPSYPSYIGPFYITLSIMMTFALNQSSHDILYTVLLPVRKIDTVKARFLYCSILEVLSLLMGAIAAVVRHFGGFPQNNAGIDLTFAYFGLQLIIFAVFNLIFFGNVYKNPLKPGLCYFIAAVAYFLVYAISNTDGAMLERQLLVLLGGILIFAGSWYLTFCCAAKQFEKYDL